MNIEKIKEGDEVFYAGGFYTVAEVKQFPHGKMVGIFDEPPSNHVDYLNPENVNETQPCPSCQGGGCPTCGGWGLLVI